MERRREALDRFERATELPLLFLALAMVPLLLVPLFADLSETIDDALVAADWTIWAVFALQYVTRLTLTPERLHFVKREWLDLVIIVLPFLRPLRVVRSARALRLLRLARLIGFFSEAMQEARRLLLRRRLHYVLLVAGVVIFGSAALVTTLEDGSAGSIDSFGDALWWSMTTVTTVGYGDEFPVTAAGRGVAAFLMLVGIALLGVVTANIAAFFLERLPEEEEAERDRMEEILSLLAAIEARLSEGPHAPLREPPVELSQDLDPR